MGAPTSQSTFKPVCATYTRSEASCELLRGKLFIIFILLAGCGTKTIFDDEGYPLHGRTIVFKERMYALSSVKEWLIDKEFRQHDCLLGREADLWKYTRAPSFMGWVKIIKKIEGQMRFSVVKSYRIIPYGLLTMFSSEHRKIVLKSESGTLCTLRYNEVKEDEWVVKKENS